MSKIVEALLVCMILCAPALGDAENPITNSGFERIGPGGFPVDWEPVGKRVELTTEAHSGRCALRFVRAAGEKQETGLNRAWSVKSGKQGKMLAQTKGGVKFWYKAVSADGCRLGIVVIPMSAESFEDTTEARTIFEVPEEHVGDGAWHEGILRYDYSRTAEVKWVHVGVRLMGGAGEMLLDDVRYVEKVGPLLRVRRLAYWLDPARGDDAGVVIAGVTNAGDDPLPAGSAALTVPDGLKLAEKSTVELPAMRPDAEVDLKWHARGFLPAPSQLDLLAEAGGQAARGRCTIKAEMEAGGFWTERFLLSTREDVELTCRVLNCGKGRLDAVSVNVTVPDGVDLGSDAQQVIRGIAPGATGSAAWRVQTPATYGVYKIKAVLSANGAESQDSVCTFSVTDAIRSPLQRLIGRLAYRSDGRHVHFEILDDASRPLAVMPWPARITYRRPSGEVADVIPELVSVQRVSDAHVDVVAGAVDADGGRWSAELTMRQVQAKATDFALRVSCSAPREVLNIEGPTLLVGDQDKKEALFCGLEWLVGDELSSGRYDIAADHADRLRWIPHPNKITIPLMAVALPGDPTTVVGLLWDVEQEWMPGQKRPQPLFTSPDRFEGRRCHAMGMVAPNVPFGRNENERLSEKPITLAPDQEVKLACTVLVDTAAKDVLSALDAWLAMREPQPLLPLPKGSVAAQVDFSMKAYFESLWLSPEEGWLPFLGGPGIWRKPSHNRAFIHDLLLAARLTENPQSAAKYRQRAMEQLKRTGGSPAADDFGLQTGSPAQKMAGLAAVAGQAQAAQSKDGCWRSDADMKDHGVFKGMDYHELGADDAVELGTCANNARTLLRYARLTGDFRAYRAGLKAIEFMKRFDVPRAAQVWEVPVHCPDILAAAHAIDAYLEAYMFDGNPAWIGEARRWARAGLPFVYVWNDPEWKWMRYGSIPVFGASWWRCSWYGNIVQWNGLDYAYALQTLHHYDPSPANMRRNWNQYAAGITRSAMYMQSDEPKLIALWCDSYHTITGMRNWDFPPTMILRNMCALNGYPQRPNTAVLERGGTVSAVKASRCARPLGSRTAAERIHISVCGMINYASWSSDVLRANVQLHEGTTGFVLIAGATRPREVRLKGVALSELEDLTSADKPGFKYLPEEAFLFIAVPHKGKVDLLCTGLDYMPHQGIPEKVSKIAFHFDSTCEGWFAQHHLEALTARDGMLCTRSTGRDPYMARMVCDIPAQSVRLIRIGMITSSGTHGQLYWSTEETRGFSEERTASFKIQGDGAWHEYRIPVAEQESWKGTITGLRLDPTNAEADVRVDFILGD